MKEPILEFSKKLIALNSRSEHTQELSVLLNMVTQELQAYHIFHFERAGSKSILVSNTEKIPEKFRLLFNCHLDIIPAKEEQFIPKIQDGKLYGAGAMDMKANLSCALFAFKKYANELTYPCAIQFVTDEETGGYNGTKYQVEIGVRSDFVLATEPTNFHIVHQAKGVFQCAISCTGKTAHSAYPWDGENALEKMLHFLENFRNIFHNPPQNTWTTTYNFAFLETPDYGYNKIPDTCRVKIDIRFTPEDAPLIQKKLQDILPDDFTLQIYAFEPPFFTEKSHWDILKLSECIQVQTGVTPKVYGANGTSDARHFGTNGIEFGPIGGGIGTDEEWVDIESCVTYYEILWNFMKSLNNS